MELMLIQFNLHLT